ncbi:MAG: hypothetical protein HY040_05045 [Planctomycetes bacterium]|nr:hypothetical protein [Planctomycetota bacterium]
MIRVTTGSRLHFGLFGPGGGTRRQFGGVGLMVERPAVRVSVEPAATWSATGPSAERALTIARSFADVLPGNPSAFAIAVEEYSSEHTGLGTGTQLALAVARAASQSLGLAPSTVELARALGRGARSGLGTHGFERGGFLVDGGKGPSTAVAPLIAWHPFPDDWRVLLIIPRRGQGEHGTRERDAFDCLAGRDMSPTTSELARLVLLEMLPSLLEHDLPAFGDALYEFNRGSGKMFEPWQGGVYAHESTAAVVDWLRKKGIKATGQSSWGPTVFAIAEEGRLRTAMEDLRRDRVSIDSEIVLTKAAASGAHVEIS